MSFSQATLLLLQTPTPSPIPHVPERMPALFTLIYVGGFSLVVLLLLIGFILSPTIFSTSTNRRIFRGMVYVTDTESWQRIFQLASERSRWDLTDPDVARYVVRSFEYIMDLLRRFQAAEAFGLDFY